VAYQVRIENDSKENRAVALPSLASQMPNGWCMEVRGAASWASSRCFRTRRIFEITQAVRP